MPSILILIDQHCVFFHDKSNKQHDFFYPHDSRDKCEIHHTSKASRSLRESTFISATTTDDALLINLSSRELTDPGEVIGNQIS